MQARVGSAYVKLALSRVCRFIVLVRDGKDVFEEKIKADKVDSQGVVVLFLRKVFGASPAFDKDEVVAGFPRGRLISFVASEPAKTDVASEPAVIDQVGSLNSLERKWTRMDVS